VKRIAACLFLGLAALTPLLARLPEPDSVPALPASPGEIYGELFVDVQRAHVFPDQKTFPDCVPRGDPAHIVSDYRAAKRAEGILDLKAFVSAHFLIPESSSPPVPETTSLESHLVALWKRLRRAPDVAVRGSSLLPLPQPYVVPGGRFREVYYWDSYFTMLGLRESGRDDLINSMVENFAYLIKTFGFVPNGNRSYYLSRSQPPFFSLMVELLAERQGDGVYRSYLPALRAEYAYWMDERFPTRHVVQLADGSRLTRYWDRRDAPRDEAFAADEAVAQKSPRDRAGVFRDLRSAAESGWDFSSRWFVDGKDLATIETTAIVPIDLNCLLFHLEQTLAQAYDATGDEVSGQRVRNAAAKRKRALLSACWSEEDGFFLDYDLKQKGRRSGLTLAGVAPLFFHLATQHQADAVAETVRRRFLRPGGVVTTLVDTGQQWDAPNGWAPLEWMTIRGLENYGHHALAADIAYRWLRLNRDVYARTGKMMEKYNVENTALAAGGGEYPSQDGFGWTNGVYLKLLHDYPEPER
jgi:alpha,alpha-trehalase